MAREAEARERLERARIRFCAARLASEDEHQAAKAEYDEALVEYVAATAGRMQKLSAALDAS